MSLGLGDLKKKGSRPSKSNRKKKPDPIDPAVWATRSFIARPWSSNQVAKPGRGRPIDSDGAMTMSWSEALSATGAFEYFSSSALLVYQNRLIEVEEWVATNVSEPLQKIVGFLRQAPAGGTKGE